MTTDKYELNVTTRAAKGDVHLVPVFQKDLVAVFKLLSERNPESDALVGPVGSTPGSPVPPWSEEDLKALFRLCKRVHRAILTCMAEAGTAGRAATYEELRAAGAVASKDPAFSFDKTRGNLGWISRYMVKVKNSTEGLFFFLDKGVDVPTGERYEYRMPKAIADMWLRITRKGSAFDVVPPADGI